MMDMLWDAFSTVIKMNDNELSAPLQCLQFIQRPRPVGAEQL
jgi:hypothetical protein